MGKILFVNFTDIYGGGEVFLKNVINYKSDKISNEDKILLTPKSEKLERELEGIKIIHGFSRQGNFISKSNFISMMKEIKLINNIIRDNKIDCIFLNGIDSYYLSKFINNKVKKIGVWHGINMERTFLKKTLSAISFNNLDNIIVVSNYQKDIINDIFSYKYDSKIKVVHIGRDEKLFKNEVYRSEKENNIINLLTVARLQKLKGHEDLIKAMKILCNRYKNIKLIIAGEGEEKENIEEQIKEYKLEKYIEMTGFVNPMDYYGKSDIFILPSYSEAFPLVNLEAMASGLPIIATNVGGIPEAIESNKQGYLIEPGNVKELADKISILIESRELRNEFGMNSRKKFLEKFTLNNMCKKIYTIILK